MEIIITQFQKDCLQFIEAVHGQHPEIIITKEGKPWAKLIAVDQSPTDTAFVNTPYVGALSGAGKTLGDLLEPLEDEWACD